jgi:hypothetical protein
MTYLPNLHVDITNERERGLVHGQRMQASEHAIIASLLEYFIQSRSLRAQDRVFSFSPGQFNRLLHLVASSLRESVLVTFHTWLIPPDTAVQPAPTSLVRRSNRLSIADDGDDSSRLVDIFRPVRHSWRRGPYRVDSIVLVEPSQLNCSQP